MNKLDKIKSDVLEWLNPDNECCLDRLAQIYSDKLTALKEAGENGNIPARQLYARFYIALAQEHEAAS